jgi:anti-sigma regulatory factor (Ser/Thr protein kinase)
MPDGFAHPALLYRDADEYLVGTVPFVLAALDAGEPVAVAVPGPNLALLRDALGERAGEVHMIDMTVAGRNPGRIIPSVLLAFAGLYPDGPVRIIGEPIWPGRTEAEYPACVQHEALINMAFAGRAASILCPYDVSQLDARVIDDAARTHPVLVDVAGERPSPDYAPLDAIDRYNVALPAPTDRPINAYLFSGANLAQARAYAGAFAARAGLSPDRVADVERSVVEIADNSIRYGGGRGVLEMWVGDGSVVCQVRDTGTIVDLLVGKRPATVERPSEGGILRANRMADLVRVHTAPDQTTVRLHFGRVLVTAADDTTG